jgi:hypothetical protein
VLEGLVVIQLVKKFAKFLQHVSSLPPTQEPVIRPFAEPDEYKPCRTFKFFNYIFWYVKVTHAPSKES